MPWFSFRRITMAPNRAATPDDFVMVHGDFAIVYGRYVAYTTGGDDQSKG